MSLSGEIKKMGYDPPSHALQKSVSEKQAIILWANKLNFDPVQK